MQKENKKPVIGILGGIASGKSTVAKELENRGCAVIDADAIAKQFLQTDDVKQQIRNGFGDSVFDAEGRVDRAKLAEMVFTDRASVEAINAIVHPKVLKRTEELISQYQNDSRVKAIVLDAPLLLEAGWEKRCDKLIFVNCDRLIKLERASKKGVLDENQLKKRENFQISLDKKAKISHYMVDNNNGLSELTKQIGEIFPALISIE
ncbi:MAG: dephospho-CoA kinase [Planctomycetes bacterium]|nr:dephospho-CoA kinase [Planctomycetota bacterium]MBU1518291.1 dephospho-CoA kinase [Planctomycetota bacterium]MBU2458163.1 dephospho-CoA kinase [Planctomycetota bacterium]MBU2596631.1 dephospho-CoA kinase [Planctomycetota bacterium]